MKRTNYKRKATAKKYRGAGRRVYKTKAGYRVSPECPRSAAKRRALIKRRTKTKRRRAKVVRRRRYTDDIPF
jgi:hypothetical protein